MSDLNDPRVFFAAERTLLAWNRTAISLMAFGFVVERFGLFLNIVGREEVKIFQRHISFLIGVTFILLAAFLAAYSALQHKRFVDALRPIEIPLGYNATVAMMVNGLVALLGLMLTVYLVRGLI